MNVDSARSTLRVFGCFLAIHFLVFTGLPTLLTTNLPLDTIEALSWGHEWQWGYYKHPPMSAWLAELFHWGPYDWPLYALSQTMVVTALMGSWCLAAELVGAKRATYAVMALEGLHYYNLTSIEFNANVVMYPFWAWASFAFWRALNTRKSAWWIALGLACGLGTLGKYVFLTLPGCMVLYLLLHPKGRPLWGTGGPWVAAAVFCVIVSPHVWWLLQNGSPTLHYAMERGHANAMPSHVHWAHELFNFILAQSLTALPMLGLLSLMGWQIKLRWRALSAQQWALLSISAGPILLFIAAAVILHIQLLDMWAAPVFLCSAPALLALHRPTQVHERRFKLALAVWMLILVLIYVTVMTQGPKHKNHPDRTDYPGRLLASQLEKKWQQLAGTPLSIVAGDAWVGGNIAAYASQRPQFYIDAQSAKAPWLNDEVLIRKGALFVWPTNNDIQLTQLIQRFPGLKRMPNLSVSTPFQGSTYETTIAWAILLPNNSRPTPTDQPTSLNPLLNDHQQPTH